MQLLKPKEPLEHLQSHIKNMNVYVLKIFFHVS